MVSLQLSECNLVYGMLLALLYSLLMVRYPMNNGNSDFEDEHSHLRNENLLLFLRKSLLCACLFCLFYVLFFGLVILELLFSLLLRLYILFLSLLLIIHHALLLLKHILLGKGFLLGKILKEICHTFFKFVFYMIFYLNFLGNIINLG